MQTFLLGLQYFFIDLLGGIVRWPFWWYTKGALFVAKQGFAWVAGYAKSLALRVWLKNLFVPMYGMYDWTSRLISFFMRLVQILFRAIGVCFLAVMVLALFTLYLSLPVATVGLAIWQIVNLYG